MKLFPLIALVLLAGCSDEKITQIIPLCAAGNQPIAFVVSDQNNIKVYELVSMPMRGRSPCEEMYSPENTFLDIGRLSDGKAVVIASGSHGAFKAPRKDPSAGWTATIDPQTTRLFIRSENCWHAQDIDGNREGRCTGTP